MNITVNNKSHFLQENTVLSKLLEILTISSDGIAVAINEEVIPKEDWKTTNLENNDTILIIQATQGG